MGCRLRAAETTNSLIFRQRNPNRRCRLPALDASVSAPTGSARSVDRASGSYGGLNPDVGEEAFNLALVAVRLWSVDLSAAAGTCGRCTLPKRLPASLARSGRRSHAKARRLAQLERAVLDTAKRLTQDRKRPQTSSSTNEPSAVGCRRPAAARTRAELSKRVDDHRSVCIEANSGYD